MKKKLSCRFGVHEFARFEELNTAEPLAPEFFYCKKCGVVYQKGFIDLMGTKIGTVKIDKDGKAIGGTFIRLNKEKLNK